LAWEPGIRGRPRSEITIGHLATGAVPSHACIKAPSDLRMVFRAAIRASMSAILASARRRTSAQVAPSSSRIDRRSWTSYSENPRSLALRMNVTRSTVSGEYERNPRTLRWGPADEALPLVKSDRFDAHSRLCGDYPDREALARFSFGVHPSQSGIRTLSTESRGSVRACLIAAGEKNSLSVSPRSLAPRQPEGV
jgi:hypothetical protein